MDIYFILIGVILILPVAFSGIRILDNRNRVILQISIFCIFFLMVLKAPSVGRDIAGYKKVYEAMEYQTWDNYDLTWMEWGYEFLMMVFTHIFKASFQTFMACIYGFVYFSYYKFLRRYSQDYTTSLILYTCFTFWAFDMSAVRTVIGVAICLFAIPYAQERKKKTFLKFFLIVVIAAQIHKSAYVFFVVYFVIKIAFSAKSAIFYVGVPIVLMIFKGQFYGIINTYFKSVQEVSVSLGGNILVYIASIVLTIFVRIYYKKHVGGTISIDNDSYNTIQGNFLDTGLAMRMIYIGIVLQLFGTGTILTRMAQYFQVFILVLIPNSLCRLDLKSRTIAKLILYALAVAYFVRYTLMPDPLDIVPYEMFWNA